jgi:hypothetical protein
MQVPRSVYPENRRKALYGELRKHLGEVFHDLAKQRESKIEQGNLVIDHVHMLISIPPKYWVDQVVGFIKGKSAIHIARTYYRTEEWPDAAAQAARDILPIDRAEKPARRRCGMGRDTNAEFLSVGGEMPNKSSGCGDKT